jgi:hypothetical protein
MLEAAWNVDCRWHFDVHGAGLVRRGIGMFFTHPPRFTRRTDMTEPNKAVEPSEEQRRALGDALREASQSQPDTFKEEENAHKIVDVPKDIQHRPIENLDPEPDRR